MLDKSRIKNPGFFGRIIASIFKKKPTSEVWIMNIDEYGDKNWHNTYVARKKMSVKALNNLEMADILLPQRQVLRVQERMIYG